MLIKIFYWFVIKGCPLLNVKEQRDHGVSALWDRDGQGLAVGLDRGLYLSQKPNF